MVIGKQLRSRAKEHRTALTLAEAICGIGCGVPRETRGRLSPSGQYYCSEQRASEVWHLNERACFE